MPCPKCPAKVRSHFRTNRIDITEAIKSLSDDERASVLLFYMEDMPLRKIASVTGMPEGTVKSHLSRARTKLARLLQH